MISTKILYLPSVAKRILFFGSDQVSLIALEALHRRRSTLQLTAVTSPPVNGRPSLVQQFCTQHGLQCTHVRCNQKIGRDTLSLSETGYQLADVSVVVSFRYYLPKWLLHECPPAINMHPSLLPRYRGPGPIFAALRNNSLTSGVSIIKIRPEDKMDCGDVLLQRPMNVPADMDIRQYFPAITQLGQQCAVDVLDDFDRYWKSAKPQIIDSDITGDEELSKFSYAPKLNRTSGQIDWTLLSAVDAFGLWRSLVSYYPVYSFVNKVATPVGKRLKDPAKKKPTRIIFNEIISPWQESAASVLKEIGCRLVKPGSVFISSDTKTVAIRCRNDWLVVTEVTLHGGRKMPMGTLLNGFELKPGTVYADVLMTP